MTKRNLLKSNSENKIDEAIGHAKKNNTVDKKLTSMDFEEIEQILSVELNKRLSLTAPEENGKKNQEGKETADSVTSAVQTSDVSETVANTVSYSNDRSYSLFNPNYLGTSSIFKNASQSLVDSAELPFDPLLPIEISGIEDNIPLSKVSTNELFPIDWSYKSPNIRENMWSYEYNSDPLSRENSGELFTFENVTTIFASNQPKANISKEKYSTSGTSSKPRKSIFSNLFEETSLSSASTDDHNLLKDFNQNKIQVEPKHTIFKIENTLNTPQHILNSAWPVQEFAPQVLTSNLKDSNGIITQHIVPTFIAPQVRQGIDPNTNSANSIVEMLRIKSECPEVLNTSNAIDYINNNCGAPLTQSYNNFRNLNEFENFIPQSSYSNNSNHYAQDYYISSQHSGHFSRKSSLSYESSQFSPGIMFKNLTDEDIQKNLETVQNYFGEPTKETLDIKHSYAYLDNHLLPKLTYPIDSQGDITKYKLIACCFKNTRLDVFYISNDNRDNLKNLKIGDLVIVEADRGKDLGKVVKMNVSVLEARLLRYAQYLGRNATTSEEAHKRPVLNFPKLVLRYARNEELLTNHSKIEDENRAIEFCQAKIREYGLQLTVVDAEYQWDMKKLTFYYTSDLRIDFRDLVKDLFRTYKIRIWMSKHSCNY